ncbi:unnamed protein product [Leuciscus chuanchicus]
MQGDPARREQLGLGVLLKDTSTLGMCLTDGAVPQIPGNKGVLAIFKSSGGWGSWKLTLIPPDESGYNTKHLKTATQGFKGVLYIAPLQMELDTTALPPESETFNDMPKEKCQRCGISCPLLILTAHIKTCVTNDDAEQTSDEAEQNKQAIEDP